MFKKSTLAVLLSTICAFSASAMTVDVSSVGKDEAAALKSASVKAVRDVMIKMTGDDFVKSHVKEVRSEIILKADQYVAGTNVVSSEAADGGNVKLQVNVDVDETKLASALTSLGADVDAAYRPKEDANSGGSESSSAQTTTPGTQTSETQTAQAPGAFFDPADFPAVPSVSIPGVSAALPAPAVTAYAGDPKSAGRHATSLIATGAGDILNLFSDKIKVVPNTAADTDTSFVYDVLAEGKKLFSATMTNAYGSNFVDTILTYDSGFDSLLENLPEAARPLVKDAFRSVRSHYDLSADTAQITFGLSGKIDAKPESISWKNARSKVTLYGASKNSSEFDMHYVADEFSRDDGEGWKMSAKDGSYVYQNRADRNLLRVHAGKIDAGDEDGGMTISDLAFGFESGPSADKVVNMVDYSWGVWLGQFKGYGMDITDVGAGIGFRNLNLSSVAQICGAAKDQPLTAGAFLKCAIQKQNDFDSEKMFFSMLQNATSLDLKLQAKLDGHPVDLSGSVTFGDVKDFSDGDTVGEKMTLSADLKLARALFDLKQYQLDGVKDFAVKFVGDPNADVYEFHMELRGGNFTINGKNPDEMDERVDDTNDTVESGDDVGAPDDELEYETVETR